MADNQNSGQDQEVEIARLQEKLAFLEKQVTTTEAKIEALEKDREAALRWGITLLGTALISLATWVFNHFVAKVPS